MPCYYDSSLSDPFRYKTDMSNKICTHRTAFANVNIQLKLSITYVFYWESYLVLIHIYDLSKSHCCVPYYEKFAAYKDRL